MLEWALFLMCPLSPFFFFYFLVFLVCEFESGVSVRFGLVLGSFLSSKFCYVCF